MKKNYRPYILDLLLTLLMILLVCLSLRYLGTVMKIVAVVIFLLFAVCCLSIDGIVTDFKVVCDLVGRKTVTDVVFVKKVSVREEKVMLEKWGKGRMRERFYDHLITAESGSGEEIKLIAPKAEICEENKSYRVTTGMCRTSYSRRKRTSVTSEIVRFGFTKGYYLCL